MSILGINKDQSLTVKGKRRRLALIRWRDSCSHPQHWTRVHDLEKECADVSLGFSVGWILKIDRDSVSLCPHVNEIPGEGGGVDGCGGMTIPREAILSIKYLT